MLAAGEAHGIRPVGLRALSSLRMEKGYRDYGHDIDNTDDVYGVGLGFAVALDKPGGFTGREATLAAKERGTPHHRLVQVLLEDPEPLLFHAEPVLRDGVVVGEVRAASYGWTLGGAVGLAFVGGDGPVTPQWLAEGRGRSTSPAPGIRRGSRCGRCTTRRAPASPADGRTAAGAARRLGPWAACPVPTAAAVTSSRGRCRARARWRPSRTPASPWHVRRLTGASSSREYRCPGCHQGIARRHPARRRVAGAGRRWHRRASALARAVLAAARHAARPLRP